MADEDYFYKLENEGKRKVISQYIRSVNERAENKYRFLSGLLLVTSTVFAVVITLGNGENDSFRSLWLYRTCTVINGLSILCYSIALYENLEACNQIVRKFQGILKLPARQLSTLGDRAFLAVEAKTHKFFSVCEKMAYVTSLLTVSLLIVYAWFKN